MTKVVSLVLSEVASLGVRRAIDVISSLCSRVCHHYLGLCLRGCGGVGGRHQGGCCGRRGRRGGQDVKACDRDAKACIVPLDDVIKPAGDVAEAVLVNEDEVA